MEGNETVSDIASLFTDAMINASTSILLVSMLSTKSLKKDLYDKMQNSTEELSGLIKKCNNS